MSGKPPERTGYRQPPVSTRFVKGSSGNPKGRPPGRRNRLPYEAVLGQMVTVREDGRELRVTAAEAFLLHMAKRGLEGDGGAARATMVAIEAARAAKPGTADEPLTIVLRFVAPGEVTGTLEELGMARRLDPYRPTARIKLERWLVEAALARLGERRLSREEQEVVLAATRTPRRVNWPDWWEALP